MTVLFRKTLINRENAISVLQHYLPNAVLDLIDLESLEISKDSFIEKELSDYYSDILYKVILKGHPGFVYVLFEHKSYHDRYVHLQLLEYILKIWRLFKNQQKKGKQPGLPVVIPLFNLPWKTAMA